MVRVRVTGAWAALLATTALVASCSGRVVGKNDTGDGADSGTAHEDGGRGGAATGNGGAHAGRPSTGGRTPNTGGLLEPPSSGGAGGASCSVVSVELYGVTSSGDAGGPTPMVLAIVLDRSPYTAAPFGAGTLYGEVSAGIDAFASDPDSNFLSLGVVSFPSATDGPCPGSLCIGPGVSAVDLPVPPGEFRDALAQLGSAVDGGTESPTARLECVQEQVYQACEVYTRKGSRCATLFVTDGNVTDCDGSATSIADRAAKALYPGTIRTYSLGLPSPAVNRTVLAAMNGNPTGIGVISSTADVSDALVEIREELRGIAAAGDPTFMCKWMLPPADLWRQVSPDQVNLVLVSPTGERQVIPRTQSPHYCANTWYYDDYVTPSEILACPALCEAIRANPGAVVTAELGCDTIIAGME